MFVSNGQHCEGSDDLPSLKTTIQLALVTE
jgi:hypothetical protein